MYIKTSGFKGLRMEGVGIEDLDLLQGGSIKRGAVNVDWLIEVVVYIILDNDSVLSSIAIAELSVLAASEVDCVGDALCDIDTMSTLEVLLLN